jgi:hypothetical protein
MKQMILWLHLVLAVAYFTGGCTKSLEPARSDQVGSELVGAWRSKVQFSSGVFAAVKDLEFMYVFNAGGTMTESSNYDAAPPVPPAYGIWKKTGDRQFETVYEFFITREATVAEKATGLSGWLPGGRGVLRETITLADDGKSFHSKIHFEACDLLGKAVEGSGEAIGGGVRIDFRR